MQTKINLYNKLMLTICILWCIPRCIQLEHCTANTEGCIHRIYTQAGQLSCANCILLCPRTTCITGYIYISTISANLTLFDISIFQQRI